MSVIERLIFYFSNSLSLSLTTFIFPPSFPPSSSPTAGEDYSDVLAELRVLKIEFQRRKRIVDFTERECVNITILSDIAVENDEVFVVHLSADDSSVILNPDRAEVTIADNDSKHLVVFCMVIVQYNEDGELFHAESLIYPVE